MAKIHIACGGTGGHLFPGIALAEELQSRGHEVCLFISSKPVDAQAMENYSKFRTVILPSVGWPGVSIRIVHFITGLLNSYLKVKKEFCEQRPDAVIGMGGFISAAPLWGGFSMGIPGFLHESNVIPGRVTRRLAPRLKKVFVGFEECHLSSKNVFYTGTPVRRSLKALSKEEASGIFGLSADKKTIVVMGGSQGARDLNTLFVEGLKQIQGDLSGWQVLHLAGEKDFERTEKLYTDHAIEEIETQRIAFCKNMEAAYSLADIIIARAGASSLAEISSYGIPSILIPFPHAADNHQYFNACVFAEAKAGILLNQHETTGNLFGKELGRLCADADLRERMSKNTRSLFKKDVAQQIAEEVEHAIA